MFLRNVVDKVLIWHLPEHELPASGGLWGGPRQSPGHHGEPGGALGVLGGPWKSAGVPVWSLGGSCEVSGRPWGSLTGPCEGGGGSLVVLWGSLGVPLGHWEVAGKVLGGPHGCI